MANQKTKIKRWVRRKRHIRKSIHGTAERPRLTIFKSQTHIYAQVINDDDQKTIVSASTIDKNMKDQVKPGMNRTEKCKLVGTFIAKRALEANIKKVNFDRNGYLYHGRVKALADSAREAGLEF